MNRLTHEIVWGHMRFRLWAWKNYHDANNRGHHEAAMMWLDKIVLVNQLIFDIVGSDTELVLYLHHALAQRPTQQRLKSGVPRYQSRMVEGWEHEAGYDFTPLY